MRNDHRRQGIGIIGYGGFGQFLHHSWSSMDEVVVRAVADANPDLRAAVAESTRFYTDWRALLDDSSVDIVSIATPPFTHAEFACEAMRAGKHVLIEKPLATTAEDARRIRTTAQETGCVAAVDYMLRFNPIVEALQQWARDGSFGMLRRVVVENYAQDESLAPEHWFWDFAQSGGILVEHAVHFIDIVNGCTAAGPVSVDGLAVKRDDGRIDRMGLTAVYADGLVTQQYHAFSRPGFFEETGLRFVFDLAQVDVEGWIPLRGTIHALVNDKTSPVLERLPGLEIHECKPIAERVDASRPAGWGASDNRGAGPQVDAAAENRDSNRQMSDAADNRDANREVSGAADNRGANSQVPSTADDRHVNPGAAGGREDAHRVHSGGVAYRLNEQVRGHFSLPIPKSEAYASALRSMMADVVAGIRSPDHRLRAGLSEGERSLNIALAATERGVGRLSGSREEGEAEDAPFH